MSIPTATELRGEILVEDIEFMVASGEWPERIASRTGLSIAAVSRLLYRHNRADLARDFEQFAKRADRHRDRRRT